MRLFFTLFIIIFVFFINALHSEDIRIETTVHNPKSSFTIGDKIKLNYHLIYDSNLKLIQPNVYSEFSNFEIMDYSLDFSRTNFRVTLTSFEFGDFEIPSIVFYFEDTVTNRVYTRVSDCISIKIDTIFLTKNPVLKEISNKKLLEYELNYILLFSLILFLSIIFFLLFKTVKNNRNRSDC